MFYLSSKNQKARWLLTGTLVLLMLVLAFSDAGRVVSEKMKYHITSWQSDSLQANSFRHEIGKIERKNSLLGEVRSAQSLIQSQQYLAAAAKLKEVIVRKPNLRYPYILLGEVYLQSGNIQSLDGLIVELKQRFDSDELAEVFLIRKNIAANDFLAASNALKNLTFEKELEAIPADVLFYYGTFAALQNDHETAKKVFSILERMPVKNLELIVSADGVKDSLDVALDESYISPHIAQKVSDLVTIYQEFKQVSDGEDPHLFVLIAKKLAENNESVLAQGFAEIALREKPDYTDGWMVRGYSYYLQGKYDLALADFNAAYKLDPIRAENHYFLALTLTELGRDGEAALYYEKVLEQPNFAFAEDLQWRLVDILLRQKKYDQVVGVYKKLAAESTDLEKFVAPIHQLLEIAHRPDLALALTKSMYELHSSDVLAANLYAWSLIVDSQFVSAQGVLQAAIKIDAENPRTYLNLGLLNERQQKINDAIEHYKTAYDLGKENRVFASVANLAADAYNRLATTQSPAVLEDAGRSKNSP